MKSIRAAMVAAVLVTSVVVLSPLHVLANDDDATYIEVPIDEFDRDHWSFRPLEDSTPPTVSLTEWPRTPIDHYILWRLESKELRPAGEADRETLIRRLYLDLIGIPPSPAQLDAFLQDRRPNAYMRLVDSLLASPRFGERWGQYWLDLARFAETDGYEHDKTRPMAWKYRDWVIGAFNRDLPYNNFVQWQIAGDVLLESGQLSSVEGGRDAATATAFCLSGPDMPDINSQQERKHVLLNEITSTIGSVFLSLQIGCAQCHDHKYDAISQADFYRLRAFFEPAIRLKKNQSVTTLSPGVDPNAQTNLMIRGDWRRAGMELSAAFPRVANALQHQAAGKTSGQRREQLAQWLTHPDHPLSSRTIVNRIWQHHFGQGLSTTPSDFGVMGEEPTHPELLDYLAKRFVENGWSLKRLHREIVMSSTYRTRSIPPVEPQPLSHWQNSLGVDPNNVLLSRFPRRRLDAEALRDSMLAVSGSLNLATGGPGVRPPLPAEMVKTLLSGQWKASDRAADHARRSIYLFARRNLRYPFLATFDRPAANRSCAARRPSTTAVQSLMLFNSKLTTDAAKELAGVIGDFVAQQTVESDREASIERSVASRQCVALYRRLFARSPDDQELQQCLAFLASQQATLAAEGNRNAGRDALHDLCRVLLNSNAFLYLE